MKARKRHSWFVEFRTPAGVTNGFSVIAETLGLALIFARNVDETLGEAVKAESAGDVWDVECDHPGSMVAWDADERQHLCTRCCEHIGDLRTDEAKQEGA